MLDSRNKRKKRKMGTYHLLTNRRQIWSGQNGAKHPPQLNNLNTGLIAMQERIVSEVPNRFATILTQIACFLLLARLKFSGKRLGVKKQSFAKF